MNRFFRRRPDPDDGLGQPVTSRPKPLPREEQRLMFEGSVHWGRGLAILLSMAGVLVVFLIILTLLPRPGTGNPLDSLTNLANSSANTAPLVAGASPTPGARLATVVPSTPAAASSTGTPGPQWIALAPRGANVRAAPNTNNNPVGALAPGRQVQVIGRSADNAWYQIVWDNNQKAWVAQELLSVTTGDPTRLPVVS
jgi:hypothetical protein